MLFLIEYYNKNESYYNDTSNVTASYRKSVKNMNITTGLSETYCCQGIKIIFLPLKCNEKSKVKAITIKPVLFFDKFGIENKFRLN